MWENITDSSLDVRAERLAASQRTVPECPLSAPTLDLRKRLSLCMKLMPSARNRNSSDDHLFVGTSSRRHGPTAVLAW